MKLMYWCLIFVFVITGSSSAAVIRVPDDQPTIQAGIDAAVDGDTVLVADGTYTGDGNKNLDFWGKAITVTSENSAESTIIDCEDDGRGFYFHFGETEASIVSQFTIRNGSPPDGERYGGAIFCVGSSSPILEANIIIQNSADYGGGIASRFSSPIIQHNKITDNEGWTGGGVYCNSSSPIIQHNEISNNEGSKGSGIYCVNTSLTIQHNKISNNVASSKGGGIYCLYNSPRIQQNVIVRNSAGYGGGIYLDDCSSMIMNNTIVWNEATYSGGGISYDSAFSVLNTILWANIPNAIGGSSIDVAYSDIQGGWEGEGNINANPMFVDLSNDDFNLKAGSPCIDAGDPDSPEDPDGTRADIGAFYYHQSTIPNRIIYVDDENDTGIEDGSHEHPFNTIQGGIDAAQHGDTVLVADGTYTGLGNKNLDFGSKAITVTSRNGAENCIIDCENDGRGFYFHRSEGESSVVEGFTIQNGHDDGGGIRCISASPTIHGNIITNNWGINGGGIRCENGASPTISHNIITKNTSRESGAGIFCHLSASPVISNNIIRGNTGGHWGGGICCNIDSSPQIYSNVIADNETRDGGGIACYDASFPIIINNTIVENNASNTGGGIVSVTSSVPTIANTILWGNNPGGIYLDENGFIIITYSDIQGGFEGEGNIASYPLFVAPDNDDYHLQAGSLCIDAGDPNSPKDPDGTRADIGAFYYDQSIIPVPKGTFTLTLNKGLNMISLPNRPDIPYTAKSLAEKIEDVTLIIRYAAGFEAYLPKYHPNDGFPIEGGQGYIVNITADKAVDFTGTVWDNTNIAPSLHMPDDYETWAFVIVGRLPSELNNAGEIIVTAHNVKTELVVSRTLEMEQQFNLVFVDTSRRAVVEANNTIEVTVTDTTERILAEQLITVEPKDLANAFAFVNLRYNPIPEETNLLQNYPNPFNPETWIPFELAQGAPVTISIYDVQGQLIRTIVLGNKNAGVYVTRDRAAYWDGRDRLGQKVSSGLYYYTLESGGFSATKKMAILK